MTRIGRTDAPLSPTRLAIPSVALAAGDKPVRIISAGRHGFGVFKQGTTSYHWIGEFYWWLKAQAFTAAASK